MGETNDRLKSARRAAGFKSARAAAKKFGWPESTYASHENGQTDPVPGDAVFAYAKAFKVSPFWILYKLGPRKGSIDAMLSDQPEEVWDLARDTVATIIRHQK